MMINKKKFFSAWFVLTAIVLSVQNCGPLGSDAIHESNSPSEAVSEAEAFSKTLMPILRNNCAGCHGVSQVPKFAVDNAEAAVETIHLYQLVDLEDPANSKLVKKILSGHNGFTAALAAEVQEGIEAWALSLEENSPDKDDTAPDIQITTPSNNSSVSGVIFVGANASDDVDVIGVTFFVDGNQIDIEDRAAPFAVSLNTSLLSSGSHTLTARARDAAGNFRTSVAVKLTVP